MVAPPIVVYEDNPAAAAYIERIVRAYTHGPTVLNTPSAAAVEKYITMAPCATLFFLDVMHESTGSTEGLCLAENIGAKRAGHLIVFLTAYPELVFADPVYKTGCFSIIHKRVDAEEEITKTISLAANAMSPHCLCIAHQGRFENLYLPFDGISYLETVKSAKKLYVHCDNGTFLIRGTLDKTLPLLDGRFVRCHQSYAVNTHKIWRVDKRTHTLHLHTGESCPYTRLYFNPNLERPPW